MSTNFYMMTQNKQLVEKYFPCEYEIVDTPYFGYEVHIGKRSCGWKPLFQAHNNAYQSVAEMKEFIKKHKEHIHIFDEYENELTLEALEKELIQWHKRQEIKYMKYVDDLCDGKKQFIESTEQDYDITIPFDHVEYEKFYQYTNTPEFFKDKDGYDFTKEWFR